MTISTVVYKKKSHELFADDRVALVGWQGPRIFVSV